MPDSLKPINRVWHPKPISGVPTKAKFDIYGEALPEPDVREKNTASIWSTFEALQAANVEQAPKAPAD
jgi:hypothetical protein